MEFGIQNTNDAIVMMLRILRTPLVHRIVTIELIKHKAEIPSHKSLCVEDLPNKQTNEMEQKQEKDIIDRKEETEKEEGKEECKEELNEKKTEKENTKEMSTPQLLKKKPTPLLQLPLGVLNPQPVWSEIKERGQ